MLRNKIYYFMLALFSVVFAVLYNEYMTTLFAVSIFLLPIFLLFILIYQAKKLGVTLQATATIPQKNQHILVDIKLKNNTILPITKVDIILEYKHGFEEWTVKKKWNIPLDYYKEEIVRVAFQSEFCGMLSVSIKKIRVHDYFLLWGWNKKCKEKIYIPIMPNIIEIEDFIIPSNRSVEIESEEFSMIKSGDDPSQIFQIRNYREGDRLQRIHWKLTSKNNQLMVKEFSLPISCQVLLAVDFFNPELEAKGFELDRILEYVVSMSYTLLLQEHPHIIMWYEKETTHVSRFYIAAEEDFYEMIKQLLYIQYYPSGCSVLETQMIEYPQERYSHIYYISNRIVEELVDKFKQSQLNAVVEIKQIGQEKKAMNIKKDQIRRK